MTPRPIKVLHIISGDLWAGAEVQAFTLLTAMQKSNNVELAAILMNNGELAKKLRENDIAVTVFQEGQMSGLSIVLAMRQFMKQWQPDIVHTHRNKENILGSIANRLATNAKSVRTVHGATESLNAPFYQIHKRAQSFLNLWTGRHLQKKIIAVSVELAEKLAAHFPAEKISVIENGVDIECVRAQVAPVDFKLDQPHAVHIGIIGRLVPVKRIDLFLETAALLRKEYPHHDWRFHVIGSGPLEQTLKQRAHELGIFDHVRFHGHRTDVVACMASLDALVMCSDHEGLPMTLLEALTLGTPVIGHAVGGIKSTLMQINPELLVHTQTANAFADGILRVVNHVKASLPPLKQQVFEEHFSSVSNLNKTLEVYHHVLTGAPR